MSDQDKLSRRSGMGLAQCNKSQELEPKDPHMMKEMKEINGRRSDRHKYYDRQFSTPPRVTQKKMKAVVQDSGLGSDRQQMSRVSRRQKPKTITVRVKQEKPSRHVGFASGMMWLFVFILLVIVVGAVFLVNRDAFARTNMYSDSDSASGYQYIHIDAEKGLPEPVYLNLDDSESVSDLSGWTASDSVSGAGGVVNASGKATSSPE